MFDMIMQSSRMTQEIDDRLRRLESGGEELIRLQRKAFQDVFGAWDEEPPPEVRLTPEDYDYAKQYLFED